MVKDIEQPKKTFKKPYKKPSSNFSKEKKKPVKFSNPLKMAYSKMASNLTNKELLKEGITQFIALIEKDIIANVGKLLGSKGLQLVVKYGNKEQKNKVLMLVMAVDVESMLKSKYSFFFLRKLLKSLTNNSLKTLFLNYFSTNFVKLFKNKHTFKFLELYLTNLSIQKKLQAVQEKFTDSLYDEFSLKEFMDECSIKPRLLELEVSLFYIASYFERMNKAHQSNFVGVFLDRMNFMMKYDNWPAVLLLCTVFKAVDFKEKKEIMKKCLKDNFWDYYSQNKYFIVFLVLFMRTINDEKVQKITLCQRMSQNFYDFFKNPSLAKMLFLLFANSPSNVFHKERTSFPAEMTPIFLDKIENDSVFNKNRELIKSHLVEQTTLRESLELSQMVIKIGQNSQFSLLLGHVLQAMIKSETNSTYFESLAMNLLEQFKKNDWSQNSFVTSPSGHRFVKRIFQILNEAHLHVLEKMHPYLSEINQYFKNNIEKVLKSRLVFVLLAFLENSEFNDDLVEFLKERRSLLEQNKSDTGVKLLIELLN
jgi:hypothetical protein